MCQHGSPKGAYRSRWERLDQDRAGTLLDGITGPVENPPIRPTQCRVEPPPTSSTQDRPADRGQPRHASDRGQGHQHRISHRQRVTKRNARSPQPPRPESVFPRVRCLKDAFRRLAATALGRVVRWQGVCGHDETGSWPTRPLTHLPRSKCRPIRGGRGGKAANGNSFPLLASERLAFQLRKSQLSRRLNSWKWLPISVLVTRILIVGNAGKTKPGGITKTVDRT